MSRRVSSSIFFNTICFCLLAGLLAGCELSSNLEEDNIVAGVDFSTLFADASSSEINAVKIDWASREYPANDVQVVLEQAITVGTAPGTIRVVSHMVGGVKHYGAVIAANGLQAGEAPVLVYSHGGDSGVSVDQEVMLVLSFFADIADEYVYVIPSFRDETLSFQNTTWKSDGPASPWDRDVDDALSLLNVALELEAGADRERVGVLGFSRGAGVGMLMDVRNEQVDAVLDFFGPTDFFGAFVQDVSREILMGEPRNLPGLDFLADELLLPFQSGEISLEDIRTEMVRRSAILFVDRIERLQIHHGKADQIVPVSQAERMTEAMLAAGKTSDQFQSYLYDGGDHNPLTLDGSLDRARDFLIELKASL